MKKSRWPALILVLVLAFLYAPMFVLVANSFNLANYGERWAGFTLKWYARLFGEASKPGVREIWAALRQSLFIAGLSTIASMILGTLGAFALHRFKSWLQRGHSALVHLPLIVPDVLMGISLLLMFVACGVQLSFTTVLLAHITFCVSYVVLVVLARLQDFDFSVVEAARDLGASGWQVAWKVLLPILAPGILSGGVLAFTLSIDDYVITQFTSGPGVTTLPLRISSMMKTSRELPLINALSTLLLAATFLAVWGSQRLTKNSIRS